MNVLRARTALSQAQTAIERVTGRTKAEANALARVRELLAAADRELQPDEPVPLVLPVNDGTSAAQARRKERFW